MSSSLIQALILLVAVLATAALVSSKVGAGRPLLWAGAAILSVGKLIPVVVLSLVGLGGGTGFRGQGGFPGRGETPGAFPTAGGFPTTGGVGRGNFPSGGFQNGSVALATTLGGWLDTAFTLAGVVFLVLAVVQAARGAKAAPAPAATRPSGSAEPPAGGVPQA